MYCPLRLWKSIAEVRVKKVLCFRLCDTVLVFLHETKTILYCFLPKILTFQVGFFFFLIFFIKMKNWLKKHGKVHFFTTKSTLFIFGTAVELQILRVDTYFIHCCILVDPAHISSPFLLLFLLNFWKVYLSFSCWQPREKSKIFLLAKWYVQHVLENENHKTFSQQHKNTSFFIYKKTKASEP